MVEITTIGTAKEGSQTIDIRPTLLIGLGGTGKEVLRRLRRMFYEKYRVAGLPIMEYLWFDTDIRNQSLSGEVPDELDRRIDLTAPQKIDGRVQPEELAGYRLNKNAYPHIWDWFPSELDALPANVITQGASQIRSFGRLAFFHHYTEIHDAIERLGRKVTAQEAFADMNRDYPDYTVDTSAFDIIIISSLGGGTGSGCFIDVGFLCRDLFRTSTRTAFLVMPTVFDDVVGSAETEAVHANGFAALKELEYFMQPRFIADEDKETSEYSTHEFNWDGSSKSVSAPPFDTVYMLDNENVAGERITEFTDTFQMIAEFLLLDFDRTRFAAQKRSVRSNMEQYLQDVTGYHSGSYVQYFPCRYASFGLSQIELNQPRLANAAANRCAQYLVDLIMAKDNRIPQGYDDADVKPRLEGMGLTEKLFLQRCLAKPGKDFTLIDEVVNELIEPAFNKLQNELHTAPAVEDQKVLDHLVEKTRQDMGRLVREVKKQVGERLLQQGTKKGDGVTQILENIRLDRPKLEKRVEDECLELLCDPLNFGPKFMVEWLKIAVRELERIKEELQAKENQDIEAPEAPSREIEFSEDYEKYEALLKSAREEMPFAFLTKRIAINHYEERKRKSFDQNAQLITRDLVQQVEAVRDQLKQWVSDRYEQEAARRLLNPNSGRHEQEKGLLDNIIGFVGQQTEVRGADGELHVQLSGLLAKVEKFQDYLQEMANRFEGFYRSYSNRMPSVRNLDLMPELNYREEIEMYLRDKKRRTGAGFNEVLQGVLEAYFRSEEARPLFAEYATREGNEIDAIRDCTRIIFNRSANRDNIPHAWGEVEDSLSEFAFGLFKEFYADRNAVQEVQNQNYNEEDEIRKRSGLAEPRMSESTPRFLGMDPHIQITIGLPPDENRWETPIKQNVQDLQMAHHAPDSVIFVSQWMAFPLFAIDNLRQLHEAYERNLRMPQNVYKRYTTKDYIKYPEILPPKNDHEAQMLVDALQPLIGGILLGVVTYDDRGFYRTYRVQGRRHEDYYGLNLEEARQTLARDQNIRDRLRQEVQNIQDGWQLDGNDLAFERYLALQSHLVNHVYPATKVVIHGESVGADGLFHNLLGKAFDENFNDVRERLDISDRELGNRIEQYLQNKDNFAKRLDYRDPHCKDGIYVMAGADA
jgi:hypothetical protein